MTEQKQEIVIHSDEDVARQIEAALREEPGVSFNASETRSMGGDEPTWIVVLQLTVIALPTIKDLILAFVRQNRITYISKGDFELRGAIKVEDAERLVTKAIKPE